MLLMSHILWIMSVDIDIDGGCLKIPMSRFCLNFRALRQKTFVLHDLKRHFIIKKAPRSLRGLPKKNLCVVVILVHFLLPLFPNSLVTHGLCNICACIVKM